MLKLHDAREQKSNEIPYNNHNDNAVDTFFSAAGPARRCAGRQF
jgi:hypothetical protein